MDIFKQYATDPAAETKGRYFENGDVEFLIARAGNRTFNDMFNQQINAHKHTLDQRDTPEQRNRAEDRAEKILVDVMSKTVLLGWRGLPKLNEDGTPMLLDGQPVLGKLEYNGEALEYSPANAAKVLAHKDFRTWVDGRANDFKNFLVVVQKEDEKN